MSELFRSAFGLLGGQNERGGDFVGQQVELGDIKLRVKRVLAEGLWPFNSTHSGQSMHCRFIDLCIDMIELMLPAFLNSC